MTLKELASNKRHSTLLNTQGGEYHLTANERTKVLNLAELLMNKKNGDAVGVELDGNTWRNIDALGNELDNYYVKQSPCLTAIHDVEIDGQAMVEIPKFHFLYQQTPTGHRWWVAPRRFTISGVGMSQVHKGFVYNGLEKDCFQIGAYEVSVSDNKACSVRNVTPSYNIAFNDWLTYCTNRGNGFVMQSYWQRGATNLLYLIDNGSPEIADGNSATQTYAACGSTGVIWRGINEMSGNMQEYVRGLRRVSNAYHLSADAGNDTLSNTGVTFSTSNLLPMETISEAYAQEGLFLPTSVGNSGLWGKGVFRGASKTSTLPASVNGSNYDPSGIFNMCYYETATTADPYRSTRLARVY